MLKNPQRGVFQQPASAEVAAEGGGARAGGLSSAPPAGRGGSRSGGLRGRLLDRVVPPPPADPAGVGSGGRPAVGGARSSARGGLVSAGGGLVAEGAALDSPHSRGAHETPIVAMKALGPGWIDVR